MLIPSNYKGVLFFDDAIPRSSIKLSTEQKSLLKQITSLVNTNLGKTVAKDAENQRLISVLITLLNLESNSHSNVAFGYKCFRLYQLSCDGELITCKGKYKNTRKDISLIGMDNFGNTTCYLDSLIVALFYSNSSFDFLLDKTLDPNLSLDLQKQIGRLKIVLRFIVNLLRAGEHINVNIMYQFLLILNALGCDLALSGKQQDSLQAFEFLAESLSLPLLTLKLDIIHTGKLNVSDDLRLIGERALFISIPTSSSSLELPITLEECLNTYFNNSITVRRHIDQKMHSNSTNPVYSISENNNTSEKVCCDSEESLIDNEKEINEYEKLGILTSSNESEPSTLFNQNSSDLSSTHTGQRNTESSIITLERQGSDVDAQSSSRSLQTSLEESESSIIESNQSNASNPQRYTSSSVVDFIPSPSVNRSATTSSTLDSGSLIGSFKNVSQRLEHQRTRSSTLTSVLNNVPIINPNKLTRRSSSISNTEVSLPAWMYLQLLPYYTNPDVKLTVENHEEYYRSRISRSKTIDSVQNSPLPLAQKDPKESAHDNGNLQDRLEKEFYFENQFGNKRPVIPICLKRYIWNERGQSVKIKRKVIVPEIIKYPYFIAEDKTRPGFVDFKRSFDHKAPRGSFMLVLQSCVCHRGHSTDSGHYVSLVRKKQFDISQIETKSEWLIFNDLELGKDKVESLTFDKAMQQEDPYILFYEIFELKNVQNLTGLKEQPNSRKQSIVSGISGYSEQTLQETSSVESSKVLNPYSTKHVMHLSLAGLALSKSRSKNINYDFDDVLDEYYWYDTSSFNKTGNQFKSNYSISTNDSIQKSKHSSNSSSTSSKFASTEDFTQVRVMEVKESNSTNSTESMNEGNGQIEYEANSDELEINSDEMIENLPSHDSIHQSKLALTVCDSFSHSNDNKSIKSSKSTKSFKSFKSLGTIRDEGLKSERTHTEKPTKSEKKGRLGRRRTVKALFKKVFS